MPDDVNPNGQASDPNAQGGGQPSHPEGQQPGTQSQAGTDERTFTQADVDRIVAERLKRNDEKYKDYKDLKTKATELDEIKKAQMTEQERIKTELAQAQQAQAEAIARANTKLMRAAFVAEAAKLGAAHPEDAYALADLAAVKISDDDTVTGVAEQVKALVDSGRLPTARRPQAPPLDGGAGGGDRPSPQATKLTAEQLDIARKLGVTPEQYAKSLKKKE